MTTPLTLPLQDGTKWSDGSELTADDVVFTFELGKTASVNFSTRLAVHRLGQGHRSSHGRVQGEVQARTTRSSSRTSSRAF